MNPQTTNPQRFPGVTAWSAYDALDDFLADLSTAGFAADRETSAKITFTVNGKRSGASFDRTKRTLFVNASGTVFETGKPYAPTQIYALLRHSGDRSHACKDLYDRGYGDRIERGSNPSNLPAGKICPASASAIDAPKQGGICPSTNVPYLSAKHQMQLAASAIAPEVIAARGYETISDAARLLALGFSRTQSENVPGLLVPSCDAFGVTHHQYRPDRPRPDGPKYETPPGKPGKYGLDIPAGCREEVLHGNGEIWITEGSKKADALVSVGVACVSIPGVWMFLRENASGKKAMLPDFDQMNLKRIVNLCFDSDAMTKASVYSALRRLANGVTRRGASEHFCYLPDDRETKTGVDDYLAQGHSIEDLQALCEDRLRPISTAPAVAMIDDLNQKFKGMATFGPKRVRKTAECGSSEALSMMKAVFGHQIGFADECKFFYGDLCAGLDLPYGRKTKVLESVVGKSNAANIGKWAVVCREFSGDRDYFRDALPMTVLREIAARAHETQDMILREYLEAQESGMCLTGDAICARCRELEGLPPLSVEHRIPHENGDPSSVGSDSNAVDPIKAFVHLMLPETLATLHQLQAEHGTEITAQLITAQFPAMLEYAVQRARENARSEEQSPFPTGSSYKNPSPTLIREESGSGAFPIDREIYCDSYVKSSRREDLTDVSTVQFDQIAALLERPAAPAETSARGLMLFGEIIANDPELSRLADGVVETNVVLRLLSPGEPEALPDMEPDPFALPPALQCFEPLIEKCKMRCDKHPDLDANDPARQVLAAVQTYLRHVDEDAPPVGRLEALLDALASLQRLHEEAMQKRLHLIPPEARRERA